jgi:DNA-binding transcriptional MerR regulator
VTVTAILDLERAGFTREQVEALARLLETQTVTKADLAEAKAELKADLAETRTELKADLAETRTELKADIAHLASELKLLEQRMTVKLGGMIGATVVLIGAFLKLFPGGHP